jgi:membrane protease YdiL (CAAX protease family)
VGGFGPPGVTTPRDLGTLPGVHVVAAALTIGLIAYFLVMGVLGRRRFDTFLTRLRQDPTLRVRYYQRGIVRQWATVALIAVIGLLAGRHPADIGLRRPTHAFDTSASSLIGLVVGLALGLVVVARLRRSAGGRRRLEVLMGKVHDLLPTNGTERGWFAPLALTAGICEEIMFRGFLIAALWWMAPHASRTTILIAAAVVFGLAHLYQGPRGVVLTGIVGYLLGQLALSSGSLAWAMVLHVLIDLRWALLPDTGDPDDDPAVGAGPPLTGSGPGEPSVEFGQFGP